MRHSKPQAAIFALVIAASLTAAAAAQEYTLDPKHISVVFRIEHAGVSHIYGRFNEITGSFTLDRANPANSSFAIAINPASIDTGNEQRDAHLRNDDFFDVKQFPTLTFTSTKVEPAEGGYLVTGDLTMHGVKQAITFTVRDGGVSERDPQRTGVTGQFTVSRKAFGVGKPKFENTLGDEVVVMFGLEGLAK